MSLLLARWPCGREPVRSSAEAIKPLCQRPGRSCRSPPPVGWHDRTGHHLGMDIREIQIAIEGLPTDQQRTLLDWLAERGLQRWDTQIEEDFSEGEAGMELLDRQEPGRTRPLRANARRPEPALSFRYLYCRSSGSATRRSRQGFKSGQPTWVDRTAPSRIAGQ